MNPSTQCERRYGTYQGTAALITETPTQELRNHSESEAMSSSCDTLGDVAVPVPSREHVGWSSFSWHSDHHCLHGGQKESTASGFYTANVSLNVFERVIVEIGGSPVTIPNIIGKRSWAIIVGIDHYSDGLSLGGCVNDAKLVVDYLVNSLYVPQSHILVLASPHDEYLRTTAGHCSLPTREAILDALYTHFRDNGDVRYGDNLLFHFSGFGSSYEGEPAFGPSLIEALCPMDRNPSSFAPTYDISDRELNMIFSEIRDSRGPNLTVVLDCSHSAGSTRSVLHGVRVALPLALQNAALCMFESAANDSRRHPNTTSPLSSTWKGDMTSHVLLAACQSYETAKEITVPQGKQLTLGAFTFALISALTSPRGVDPALTYVDLTKSVIQRPVCQTPVVAGKRKRSRLWFQKGSVPKRTVAIRGTVGASGGQE
ncbi:hypothetical protein PENSPDRAFT_101424 [Peniophora sp. CONT]|nr:hypothetical protein PENSPDRAFT_101424 [Peniophora sp. CONT]